MESPCCAAKSLKNLKRVSFSLFSSTSSVPCDMIMSYSRWYAERVTSGCSRTMSRYSSKDPSQCFLRYSLRFCCCRKSILTDLRQQQNLNEYRKKHWEGSFEEYLDIVREHPEVTRSAYQRLYDMIMSHGTEEAYEQKEKVTKYKFFN